jgi:1,5-anhydro-D-fructose reductase (1,5-anhydro-D-mannitol-forming)
LSTADMQYTHAQKWLHFLLLFKLTLQEARAFSATPRPNLQWGVILGGTGEDEAILEAFQNVDDADIVAVLYPRQADPDAIEDKIDNDDCLLYDRRDDFLSDERVDAVWIGTPPGQHLYWTMQVASIRHSLPEVLNPPRHVCISRPMLGRSYEETATMAAALQVRKVSLYPASLMGLHSRVTALRNVLNRQAWVGRADDWQAVTYHYVATTNDAAAWKTTADTHGGGLFLEVGPLMLRFLEILLDKPLENVQGEALNRNSPDQDVEDYVWMKAQAGNATTVDGVWDFTTTVHNAQDSLFLQCGFGRIRVEGLVSEISIRIYNDESGDLIDTIPLDHAPSSAELDLKRVTQSVMQGESPSKTDLQTTFRLSSAVDRILASYYGGRGDDFFVRPASWPGIPPTRRQIYMEE